MRNVLPLSILIYLLAIPPAHAAEPVAPDLLAKSVTTEVLTILRADKGIQQGDRRKAAELIEAKVLPHFDFATMTRLAMGRNWRLATPAQREALTNEFRTLLVRLYTASLSQYRDQTIEYLPLKLMPGDTDVVVRSRIIQAGRDPVTVDYSMERTADGWKVYNFKIDGISLVENYRNTFATQIQNVGIDGLIKALAQKNKASA